MTNHYQMDLLKVHTTTDLANNFGTHHSIAPLDYQCSLAPIVVQSPLLSFGTYCFRDPVHIL